MSDRDRVRSWFPISIIGLFIATNRHSNRGVTALCAGRDSVVRSSMRLVFHLGVRQLGAADERGGPAAGDEPAGLLGPLQGDDREVPRRPGDRGRCRRRGRPRRGRSRAVGRCGSPRLPHGRAARRPRSWGLRHPSAAAMPGRSARRPREQDDLASMLDQPGRGQPTRRPGPPAWPALPAGRRPRPPARPGRAPGTSSVAPATAMP